MICRDGRRMLTKSELREEVAFLKSLLPDLKSPVVFCHNDLLLKNIIYSTKGDPGKHLLEVL